MTEVKIIIPDIPPSVNHYWIAKGNRRFISKQGRKWKDLVNAIANRKENKKYFNDKLKVEVLVVLPDKKRRDVDNFSKAILDALEGICYKDDSQIMRLAVEKTFGKPETHITIKPFEGSYD